jgi:hypothetical protein
MFVDGAFTNTVTVNESGNVTLGDATHAGTLTNMHGATWTFTDAANVIAGGAAGSHLTNEGTLTRNGVGVASIGVSTTNTGNVSVTSGELDFLSSVSNTGAMSAIGATLSLDAAVSGVGMLDLGARRHAESRLRLGRRANRRLPREWDARPGRRECLRRPH